MFFAHPLFVKRHQTVAVAGRSTHPITSAARRSTSLFSTFVLPVVLPASIAGTLSAVSINSSAAAPPYAEEWLIPAIPEDVEIDPTGRVWVSCDDDSVRVYAPTGGQLLFSFGGRGTGDGEFLTPVGIAFDPSGDAYICDYEGNRVEKFTSEGQFILSWPVPSVRSDHVAVDAAGDVYVTGYADTKVYKYSPTGDPLLDWASESAQSTAGVVVAGGIVSVVLWTAPDIEQYDSAGNYLRTLPVETVNGLDIEIDAVDQFWVSSYNAHEVKVFTADGDLVEILGSSGPGPGEFIQPSGVAIGLDGSVYVADQGTLRLQRFGDAVSETPVWESASPGLALRAIAPNPCQTQVELIYELPRTNHVELTVLDIAGRTVARLANSVADAGIHHSKWTLRESDGSRLAAGVYFIRLAGGGEVATERLVIVR